MPLEGGKSYQAGNFTIQNVRIFLLLGVCGEMPRAVELQRTPGCCGPEHGHGTTPSLPWCLSFCPVEIRGYQTDCVHPRPSASKRKCVAVAGKWSQHPQFRQTHPDQSWTDFIIPSLAEPSGCRKEALTDPGAWNTSTVGGFSLPTASAWSQSSIVLTHNLWPFFLAINKKKTW